MKENLLKRNLNDISGSAYNQKNDDSSIIDNKSIQYEKARLNKPTPRTVGEQTDQARHVAMNLHANYTSNFESSSSSLSIGADRPFDISEFYDFDSFPQSKGFAVLPWQNFTRDFESLDIKLTENIQEICEAH